MKIFQLVIMTLRIPVSDRTAYREGKGKYSNLSTRLLLKDTFASSSIPFPTPKSKQRQSS